MAGLPPERFLTSHAALPPSRRPDRRMKRPSISRPVYGDTLYHNTERGLFMILLTAITQSGPRLAIKTAAGIVILEKTQAKEASLPLTIEEALFRKRQLTASAISSVMLPH